MIFFLHIPKTAGTTFYEVVKQNHSNFLKPKMEENPHDYLKYNLNKNGSAIRLPGGYETAPQMLNVLLQLNKFKVLENVSFIGGHVGYGFHENIAQHITYMSFIRNPTERLVSDFKENCKEGRYFFQMLAQQNFNFEVYLELLLEHNMDNILTRQLAGPFNYFLEERKPIDDALIKKAISNSSFIHFFEMEEFDRALKYFKKNYGWKKIGYNIKNQSSQEILELGAYKKLIDQVIHHDEYLYNTVARVALEKENTLNLIFKKILS